jgi:hypothetical protein
MSILSVSTLPGLSSCYQVIVADEERSPSLYIARPRACYTRTRTGYISPTFLTTRIPCLPSFTQPLPGPVRFNYGSEPSGGIDKRKQEAERIRNKYNDRIPVSTSRVKFRVGCGRPVRRTVSLGMPADQFYNFRAPLSTSRLLLVNSAELIYRNLFCTDCQSSTLVASRACAHFGHIIDSYQVICEKVEKSDISDIDKKKYLVPAVSPLYSSAVTPLPRAECCSHLFRLVCRILVVVSSSILDFSSSRT